MKTETINPEARAAAVKMFRGTLTRKGWNQSEIDQAVEQAGEWFDAEDYQNAPRHRYDEYSREAVEEQVGRALEHVNDRLHTDPNYAMNRRRAEGIRREFPTHLIGPIVGAVAGNMHMTPEMAATALDISPELAAALLDIISEECSPRPSGGSR